MSRYCMKEKPTVGTVVSSIWTYVLVSISEDSQRPGTYNIFESSKHQKLEEAQEQLAYWRDREARDYHSSRYRYFLAEWKQVDGKCVCVLMDDPLLSTL